MSSVDGSNQNHPSLIAFESRVTQKKLAHDWLSHKRALPGIIVPPAGTTAPEIFKEVAGF